MGEDMTGERECGGDMTGLILLKIQIPYILSCQIMWQYMGTSFARYNSFLHMKLLIFADQGRQCYYVSCSLAGQLSSDNLIHVQPTS